MRAFWVQLNLFLLPTRFLRASRASIFYLRRVFFESGQIFLEIVSDLGEFYRVFNLRRAFKESDPILLPAVNILDMTT